MLLHHLLPHKRRDACKSLQVVHKTHSGTIASREEQTPKEDQFFIAAHIDIKKTSKEILAAEVAASSCLRRAATLAGLEFGYC